MSSHARQLKGCRYALWRNPEDLTPRQQQKLAWGAKVNGPLYRAHLLKEQLGIAIRTKGVLALTMLEEWLVWASRSRLSAFVELGRKIRRNPPTSSRPCSPTCRTRWSRARTRSSGCSTGWRSGSPNPST